MKTKVVLWGTDEHENKVLIGVELKEQENKVRVHTFPEQVATEEFYIKMMNLWREGQEIPFPDGHQEVDRPLSITEDLIPENLKTLRTDILNRAKTEWHFVVLSAKLYESYKDELEDIKERISSLTKFDNALWEEMKSFWSKVQKQAREKNLFGQHADRLRETTNELFEKLKTLRKVLNEEFEQLSKVHLKEFVEKLDDIDDRIEKGLGLQPIFNELKELQSKYKNTKFTSRDRNVLWKRIDGAFKSVKQKKYGHQDEKDPVSRITRRYKGLLSAIKNMEASIRRDVKDKDFQNKRINTTDGQLELQIRQAKLAMIEGRITSKEKKLSEMMRTKEELEKKMELERQKLVKKQEKEELAKAKKSVKNEIAQQMQNATDSRKDESVKLEEAAQEIKKRTSPKAPLPITDSEDHIDEIDKIDTPISEQQ